jgi:hypothetical protein
MEFREKQDTKNQGATKQDDDKARKDILLEVLEHVCRTYECHDEKGVLSVKFFNARRGWGHVTQKKVQDKKENYRCQGMTRIGTELKRKVIDQYVFKKDPMLKPLLVIVITDGEVCVSL